MPTMTTTSLGVHGFDVGVLQRYLDGPHADIRQRVREDALRNPQLRPPSPGLPTEAYRARVWEWAKAMAATGETGLGFPAEYGGGGDVEGFIVAFETLGHGDLSLLVKCGVQFGLFGGAVLHLGTRHHHERYLRDILSLDLPGCFAMTEIGHGSNVQALETTATYDPDAQEFVVHTPTRSATKDWIGNAAVHGRMAALFAQLIVDGTSHGVHCLLVPIRDAEGRPAPGVTIEDCGEKLGLNGVDNGRLRFDRVRVPREALLDRYAAVDDDGTYRSPIDNPDRRFFNPRVTLGRNTSSRMFRYSVSLLELVLLSNCCAPAEARPEIWVLVVSCPERADTVVGSSIRSARSGLIARLSSTGSVWPLTGGWIRAR